MKIRGLLAALLVAVVLGGCTRTATAPDRPEIRASFDETTPPPADTTGRGGGAMGNGH